jgi:hypothetical protein
MSEFSNLTLAKKEQISIEIDQLGKKEEEWYKTPTFMRHIAKKSRRKHKTQKYYYTANDIARILNVTTQTIYNAVNNKQLSLASLESIIKYSAYILHGKEFKKYVNQN